MRTLLASLLVVSGCVEDVEVPPKAPTLFPVTSPTAVPLQRLRGTRPPNTAVLKGEEEVVPAGEDTSFSFDLALAEGENTVELWTQRPSGLRSRSSTSVTIVYEPACPAAAVLDQLPPAFSNQRTHTLSGSKPAGTAVALDGAVVVPASAATTFSHALSLPQAEGTYAFTLTTRDARGRDSDPLRFTITYDVTPPQLAVRYPTSATDPVVANTGIPTGAGVFVELSEEMRTVGGSVPADLVSVSDGATAVAGATSYAPAARAFVWRPTASLPPSATLTVRLDAAAATDLAGNALASVPTWTFTTASGPSSAAPAAPTATAAQIASGPRQTVSGTREAWSAVFVNGELVAAPGAAAWSVGVALAPGVNSLAVSAQSPSGVATAGPTLTVTRAVSRPAAPALDAQVPRTSTTSSFALSGTKPPGTAVLLNGAPVACLDAQTSWAAVIELTPGVNELWLTTRDADGVESLPLVVSVDFTQAYSGKVPPGWQLKVFVNLRDLRNTRLASEFITGANNYGLDIWLEGPLSPGEICEWDAAARQRKAVKYVATLSHYVGVKTGHTVPFADDDYRGADYLAALASGKVLEFLGITEATPRRDGQGREVSGLMGRVTESDLRQKIDCYGLLGVDGCTEATVVAGPHAVDPWEPRRPPNAELLDQGEYLLWVQMNLDRSGTWLTANDTETCWGDPADFARGMHRVVRRVALGSAPWSVQLGPADELSGPDPLEAGEAKYLAPEGMTLSWGPP